MLNWGMSMIGLSQKTCRLQPRSQMSVRLGAINLEPMAASFIRRLRFF
jgi:hypothetical protein